MQIAVMFKKFYFFGITADRNKIKINNHKPIKKEEYLNLTPEQIEEEQYQRTGTKTKPEESKVSSTTCSDVKYTIFRARNGRVLIKRKPIGGDYEIMDNNNHSNFIRIKAEKSNNLKRLRCEVDALDSFNKSTYIPVLQNEVNKRFKDFDYLDAKDSDDEMGDQATMEDVDDYTSGFIQRYKQRKGYSNRNDNLVSFKV